MGSHLIREEIMSRLNSGNVYFHSVQKLLSFGLLSQYVKIKLYKKYNFASSFVWV
jgi:hypothetical protein